MEEIHALGKANHAGILQRHSGQDGSLDDTYLYFQQARMLEAQYLNTEFHQWHGAGEEPQERQEVPKRRIGENYAGQVAFAETPDTDRNRKQAELKESL